ncbi:unnamed protein product [Rodentolepis nana]|uniref:Protein kinase domain-containing protein n=1 Tax=Rodentolepis nana TaxID=102285 RepID=A0A0R3T3T5_RODNA|nr:unnamed protein product [Rodentolepis nana]
MEFSPETTFEDEFDENTNGNVVFAWPGFDANKLLIYREIFNGGFSTTVGSRDLTTGGIVAIKKVEFDYLGNIFTPIEDLKRRVLNKVREQTNKIKEIAAASVIESIDFVTEPNRIIVISQLQLSGDLFNWMLQQPVLQLRNVLLVVNYLFRAFDYLHSQGYAHGYLNPTKILFQNTAPHSVLVKPDLSIKKELAYLLNDPLITCQSCTSPEEIKRLADTFENGRQSESNFSPTKEMDIWSMGVVILIALTGVNFFQFDKIDDLRQPFDVLLEEAFRHPTMQMIGENFLINLRKVLAVDPSTRISAADAAAINWAEDANVADENLNLLYIIEHDLMNSCRYYRTYGQAVLKKLRNSIHLE